MQPIILQVSLVWLYKQTLGRAGQNDITRPQIYLVNVTKLHPGETPALPWCPGHKYQQQAWYVWNDGSSTKEMQDIKALVKAQEKNKHKEKDSLKTTRLTAMG